MEGEPLLGLDVGLPVTELADSLRLVLRGDEAPALRPGGHDRRGHAVEYTVQFDPLRGDGDGSTSGVILMLTADRLD